MTDGSRKVAFVCTDDGQHSRNVLAEWEVVDGGFRRLDRGSRERLRKAFANEAFGEELAPNDWRCRRCKRNPRITDERLATVLRALMTNRAEHRVVVDISSRESAKLF